MTKYKKISREELFSLSRGQFIERCLEWNVVFNDGKPMDVQDPKTCPVHMWVEHNNAACFKELVANTMECPVCGKPCCPECMNHSVTQISRVTGYLSDVSGWNSAKAQEFKDRQRTDVATFS